MVAPPVRFAVTTPLVETPAMLLLELDHFIVAEGSAFPAASLSVTASGCVAPVTRPIDPGVMVTRATPPVVT